VSKIENESVDKYYAGFGSLSRIEKFLMNFSKALLHFWEFHLVSPLGDADTELRV